MAAACREGWRAYLDNPAAANAEMGKLNQDMDAQTFADAATAQKPLIETDETRKIGLGMMTLERWKLLSQQLLDLKVIDKAPAPEECFINPK
jgi:NitT/TauT family transport system substrate-binding protein